MKNSAIRITFLFILGIICLLPLSASIYFVAGDGSDSSDGSFQNPFATIHKAVSLVVPGDTIFVRGGRYQETTTISIERSGTEDEACALISFPGERAILDFSEQILAESKRGIRLKASYWIIEGFDITGAANNGLKIEGGNYNQIINCAFYRNRNSGLQMGKGASYNQVINCDSYYNADPPDYADADGFAAKLDVGIENYFYGCRAWLNCDDGWDGYMRGADNASTILKNCWAFENGYLEDGTDPGPSSNGNGFKMGGSDDKTLRHDYTLMNCLAFKNKVKGFDQNSNMGSMILYNCTAHNNLGANYKIYKALAEGEELVLKNCVVLGSLGDIADFAIEETNSWMEPFTVTANDFVSVDDNPAYGPRKADGSLPDIPYMHLAEGSGLIDAGVDVGLPYFGRGPDLGCFESGIPTAIRQEEYDAMNLIIFPNPVKDGSFMIRSLGDKASLLTIYDMTGKKVYSHEHTSNEMVDVSDLDAGIYLLKLDGSESVSVGKFIIE